MSLRDPFTLPSQLVDPTLLKIAVVPIVSLHDVVLDCAIGREDGDNMAAALRRSLSQKTLVVLDAPALARFKVGRLNVREGRDHNARVELLVFAAGIGLKGETLVCPARGHHTPDPRVVLVDLRDFAHSLPDLEGWLWVRRLAGPLVMDHAVEGTVLLQHALGVSSDTAIILNQLECSFEYVLDGGNVAYSSETRSGGNGILNEGFRAFVQLHVLVLVSFPFDDASSRE